jgi:hypothetical protein
LLLKEQKRRKSTSTPQSRPEITQCKAFFTIRADCKNQIKKKIRQMSEQSQTSFSAIAQGASALLAQK